MAKALSAREAHSLKIRNALVEACIELLGQYSIDAITINNIVEVAGVAKGSFYNHFPDKEALAASISRAIREEVEAEVRDGNRNVTDPAYRISRGISHHVKLAIDEPQRATILLRDHAMATSTNPLNQDVQEDVLQGIEAGRFSPLCAEAGVVQLVGVTSATMLRVIEEKLDANQAIDLTHKVLTLTLCGFGLSEEEALRITCDSARDIIG